MRGSDRYTSRNAWYTASIKYADSAFVIGLLPDFSSRSNTIVIEFVISFLFSTAITLPLNCLSVFL